MASWAALNAEGREDRLDALERATEEAQDAENAAMYEHALRLQQHRKVDQARNIYVELLQGERRLDRHLEYLCHTNLATIELERRAYDSALVSFAAALELDATDVVVWYQMGKTTIETGKLWLARRMLEEGAKVDATYWPLLLTLCEVLHEIGDYNECERMTRYIRAHDSYCTSMNLLVSNNSEWVIPTKKRKLGETADREMKRAQARLHRLTEITQEASKRRKLLQEGMLHEFERLSETREYVLHQQSWQNMGKLLLEACEDASSVSHDAGCTHAKIRISIEDQDDNDGEFDAVLVGKLDERPKTSDIEEKSLVAEDSMQPSSYPSSEQATTNNNQKVTMKSTCSNVGLDSVSLSIPSNSDSKVVTSELDESQPVRRKSRRNEERIREEHAAAVKHAREKNLLYRLQKFLSSDAVTKETYTTWEPALTIEQSGTQFLIRDETKTVLKEIPAFVQAGVSSNAMPSLQGNNAPNYNISSTDGLKSSATKISPSHDEQHFVEKGQVAKFVTQFCQDVRLMDLLRAYLNQCGEWAQIRLCRDGEDIHPICFWTEKILDGVLNDNPVSIDPKNNGVGCSTIKFANAVRRSRHLCGNGDDGLTLKARLFLLELHFDMFIRQPSSGKKRRKHDKQLEDLIAAGQSLLVDMCWFEDDCAEELLDGNASTTTVDFVRLFWLLARMYERSGRANVGKNYYIQCREKLIAIASSNDGPNGVILPNQKADSEITLDILDEKVSGLQLSDISSEAQRYFANEQYDQVLSLLLGHFLPANQPPRMMDMLDDVNADEENSDNQLKGNMLMAIVLDSFRGSTEYSVADSISLLLTTLYHVINLLDTLTQISDGSTIYHHPEELRASALNLLQFILKKLADTQTEVSWTCDQKLLLRACSVHCLKPSILLLLESPRDMFSNICRLQAFDDNKQQKNSQGEDEEYQQCIWINAVSQTFYTIRSLENTDFRALFTMVSSPAMKKKKDSRRDRVRSLVVEILRYLNLCYTRDVTIIAKSLSPAKRSLLMKLCCQLMKDEEDNVVREDMTAQQLFGNSAILFLIMHVTLIQSHCLIEECKTLVSLVKLLHERLGQYGICGISYFEASEISERSSCFLETCANVLTKYYDNNKKQSVRVGDDEQMPHDSEEDEEDENEENWFEQEVAQIYRCLYDVQIVPGCTDHRTGKSFDALLKEPNTIREAKAIRLARFAIPMLLEEQPKNNTQKKENLKLLTAVRDALQDRDLINGTKEFTELSRLQEYLSPRDLLSWNAPTPVPSALVVKSDNDVDQSWLDHLWYLLGANFILVRGRRRGNLTELIEMEERIKERIAYLMKDVLCYHPERMESWIRLGKATKELYHAATDAYALIIGRKRKIKALSSYCKNYLHEYDQSTEINTALKHNPADQSFNQLVLNSKLFQNMKQWQDQIRSGQSMYTVRSLTETPSETDPSSSENYEVSIEEFALRYIVQVIEFSRRCFEMAAAIGARTIKERQEKQISNHTTEGCADRGNDGDEDEDEDIIDFRNTIVECEEECGLLLYNVLQEISLMKQDTTVPFPYTFYLRVAEQALVYFQKGLKVAEPDTDAHGVRFRLNYMIGKTLKKKRRCEQLANIINSTVSSSPEAITQYFVKAETAREEGEMEDALVHAFYALQAMRMELLLSEFVTLSDLRLVCEHYFEEELDDGEEDDEDDDTSENNSVSTDRKESEASKDKDGVSKQVKPKEDDKISKDDIMSLLDNVGDKSSATLEADYCFHAARAWLFLNVVDALESIPNEDRYFHPSRYVLARGVYFLEEFIHESFEKSNDRQVQRLMMALNARKHVATETEGASMAASRALKELTPLFDKKRPQIVAIWLSEHIPIVKKFEELNQRQMKYDYYRIKYWKFYIQLLEESESYNKLKDAAMWVLACKEDHDVIDEMLGIALRARGNLLRVRLQRYLLTTEQSYPSMTHIAPAIGQIELISPTHEELVGHLLKQLAKAYTFCVDLSDVHHRLVPVLADSQQLLNIAELSLVALFLVGAVEFTTEFPLVESDTTPFLDPILFSRIKRLFLQPLSAMTTAAMTDPTTDWRSFVDAARTFCEEKWPERMGKNKTVKSRGRHKPIGTGLHTTLAPSVDTKNTFTTEKVQPTQSTAQMPL